MVCCSVIALAGAMRSIAKVLDNAAMIARATRLVPPLSGSDRHKGQCGRIGVVGGCSEYTGAPYYAAAAALRAGADLSHIFCANGAAAAIKAYSPDIIVHPYLVERGDVAASGASREEEEAEASRAASSRVAAWLPALHCLVIGPGLGRDPVMLATAKHLMQLASAQGIPIVVDADGECLNACTISRFSLPRAQPSATRPFRTVSPRLLTAIAIA